MHASNLLKVVLKPRAISSNSSGQSLNPKDSQSRGTRPSSPDSVSKSVSVSKKKSPSAAPVKMSCLCAPTNHAGSFRCRLHRGTQQSWGGRPLAGSPPASKPSSSAASEIIPSVTPVAVQNGGLKKIANQMPTPRMPTVNLNQVHRGSDARPSRLSRFSVAPEVETPVTEARAEAPPPAPRSVNGSRGYLKFTGGAGCASGAVLEGGIVLMKKLQTGGKEVILDVFGSGTGLSRAGLSL